MSKALLYKRCRAYLLTNSHFINKNGPFFNKTLDKWGLAYTFV
jgi:hypothetical protein